MPTFKKQIKNIILEEIQREVFKPGLLYHVQEGIPLTECVYRVGSPCYFNVIRQGRRFYKAGLYEAINDEEKNLLENTNLGEWVLFEGKRVPLDFPMYFETIEEAKKKKKTGRIKKITYGDAKGGLKGGWNSPKARKSFAARHKCAQKKDRTKAGYWACRAHKDFGPGVGRFW